jgi:hypothetical protein
MTKTGADSLLSDVLEIMPTNMADFGSSHQRKIEQLLKIENDGLPMDQVNFAPRHRKAKLA